MTNPNPINCEQAAAKVATGAWRVDPHLGEVYGAKGNAFRRLNSHGYIQIKFRDPDDWRIEHAALAHRVIWEAVHGPIAEGLTINHIDGNKQNNRIENLEAITHLENARHARRTGLTPTLRGMETANARLTDEQVSEIYRRAWQGEDQAQIAADYSVTRNSVSNIKRGWSWTHVTGHCPTAHAAA